MDNKILEKRLQYRESSIGFLASVQKCAKSFGDVVKARNAEDAVHDKAVESLIRDVKAYEFEMKKVSGSMLALEEEMVENGRLEEELLAEQINVQHNILDLNEQLGHEHMLLNVRIECESVAERVNSLQSTTLLKRQIEEVQASICKTRENITEADERIRKRVKVVKDIAGLLDVLKTKMIIEENPAVVLEEESEEEEEGRDEEIVGIAMVQESMEEDLIGDDVDGAIESTSVGDAGADKADVKDDGEELPMDIQISTEL